MTKLERLEEQLKTTKNESELAYVKYQIKEYLKLNAFERKLADYEDVFGEAFPNALVMGMEKEEIIDIIDKALEDGEPYEVDAEHIY